MCVSMGWGWGDVFGVLVLCQFHMLMKLVYFLDMMQ